MNNELINCFVSQEKFFIHTNEGVIPFSEFAKKCGPLSIFENDDGVWKLKIIEEKEKEKKQFFSFYAKKKVEIYKIEKRLTFNKKIKKSFLYQTFRNASLACVVRFTNYSLLVGFENPFTTLKIINNKQISISFESNLIIREKESFDFDIDFSLLTKLTNKVLKLETPASPLQDKSGEFITRYHNPTIEPLDYGEIHTLQEYVKNYLECKTNKFIHEFYMYFSPIKPQPTSFEDEQEYYHYIDNFKKLNGDLIVFQPLIRQTPPSVNGKNYWEIYKKDDISERIFKYAKAKGLLCGFYMGTAQDNVNYSNSPFYKYASSKEKPNWKKIDYKKQLSEENCIADDEFCDWYINAQIETIKKYDLDFWCWDPGTGNGNFCYSDKHGHIPGKGQYKGFRNALKVVEKIKEFKPSIYLQAFHGMKEYGVWGLKYFNQHEAYWEQDPRFFATMYQNTSADIVTANGMRLQAWWNQNYRMLPAVINHSLDSRMMQNCNEPDSYYKNVFDFQGYRFAIMSALATGASITSTNVIYDLNTPWGKEYKKFFNKWSNWAKKNVLYLNNSIAFNSQPDEVKVDAYARLVNNRGYIFLCNGNLTKSQITFRLNDMIGYTQGYCTVKIIYPNNSYLINKNSGDTKFNYNDKITIDVDEQTVLLLKICTPSSPKFTSVISNLKGEEGEIRTLVFPKDSNLNEIKINGKTIKASKGNGCTYSTIRFGKRSDRYLDKWKIDNKQNITTLSCDFVINRSKQKNTHMTKFLPDILEYSSSANFYYNWTDPSKVLFVPVFKRPDKITNLKIIVNGKEVAVKNGTYWAIQDNKNCVLFADITNDIMVKNIITMSYDGPQSDFLNGYLVYSKNKTTKAISACKKSNSLWINDSLISNKPYSVGNLKIVNAELNQNFKDGEIVTLSVKLNKKQNEIKRVITSCPIGIDAKIALTMNTDRLLNYNDDNDCWEVSFKVGDRSCLIIDDDRINILAVDKENNAATYELSMNWDL